ncbi:MAG: 50S ribosomal protein L21 [Candidatus Eisenbacteria sp.]|nr:50S ribosomal protein L21 [Candidatus Eisenbacteria bacterium]
MYAVVSYQGFQYRVVEDALLRVPVFDGTEGSEVTIEDVHLIADEDDVLIGKPTIPEAAVRAEVVGHGRGPKILVGKYKRRKDYRRIRGHRTNYTELRIKEIVKP